MKQIFDENESKIMKNVTSFSKCYYFAQAQSVLIQELFLYRNISHWDLKEFKTKLVLLKETFLLLDFSF